MYDASLILSVPEELMIVGLVNHKLSTEEKQGIQGQ